MMCLSQNSLCNDTALYLNFDNNVMRTVRKYLYGYHKPGRETGRNITEYIGKASIKGFLKFVRSTPSPPN